LKRELLAFEARIMERFDKQDAKLDEHGSKLDRHEAKLDRHEAKLDKHDARLDCHEDIFTGIKKTLAHHDAEFLKLNSNMDLLVKEVLTRGTQLDQVAIECRQNGIKLDQVLRLHDDYMKIQERVWYQDTLHKQHDLHFEKLENQVNVVTMAVKDRKEQI
jgi:hypothetical protein